MSGRSQKLYYPVPEGTAAAVRAAIDKGRITIPAGVFTSDGVTFDKMPIVWWKERAEPVHFGWPGLPGTRPERQHAYLWAFLTGGPYGIVGLDFDGDGGAALLERLGLQPHCRTPDGFHLYVTHPGWKVKTTQGVLPGLDVRGDGGVLYFAGRSHKGEYRTIGDHPPYPFDALPEWVRRPTGLLEPPPPPRPAAPRGTWDDPDRPGTDDAMGWLDWWCRQTVEAPGRESNHWYHRAVYNMSRMNAAGLIDSGVVEAELKRAAEDRGAQDIAKVFESSWAAGQERGPWEPDGVGFDEAGVDDGILVLGGVEEEPCPSIPNRGDAGNRDPRTSPFPLAGKLCPFAVSVHAETDHPDIVLGVEGTTYAKRCGRWYCYVCADTMRLAHFKRGRQVVTAIWAGQPISEKLIGACEWGALYKKLGRSGAQYLRMPQPGDALLIWINAEEEGFTPVEDPVPRLVVAFQQMDRKGFNGSKGLLPPLKAKKPKLPRQTPSRRVHATKQSFEEAPALLATVPGMTVHEAAPKKWLFTWTWLPPLDPYGCCVAYHLLDDVLHDRARVHVT